MKNKKTTLLALALAATCAAASASAADLILVNQDVGTGAGLDDPTAKAPEGGNPGTTLGEQRRLVYQYAARMWGSMLDSDVPVYIGARFIPQTCTPTSATLGSAGTTFVFRNFPGAPAADTWYHSALADSIVGVDLAPGNIDIQSQFNSRINNDPTCLGGSTWYYGLDGNTPPGQINFLNVVMHEIAHGLGFSAFSNVSTGTLFNGFPDAYNRNAYNNTFAAAIPALSNAQRQAAFRDNGNTVWTGANVSAAAPLFLDNLFTLNVTAPAGIAGSYEVGAASFGPAATSANFEGEVVPGVPADACTPLTNSAAVAGKVALVDRGVCAFTIKTLNAQAAGATAVLIANNAPGIVVPGGADPAVAIPALGISQADGATIRGASPGVMITTGLNPNRRQGADATGRVRLYAPTTVAPGSTFSHFDVVLTPNALMEPSITSTLRADVDVDMTTALLKDVGWQLNARTAVGNCDTGIPAVSQTGFSIGGSVAGQAALCEAKSTTRKQYSQCLLDYAKQMAADGLLTNTQASRVVVCSVQNGYRLYPR